MVSTRFSRRVCQGSFPRDFQERYPRETPKRVLRDIFQPILPREFSRIVAWRDFPKRLPRVFSKRYFRERLPREFPREFPKGVLQEIFPREISKIVFQDIGGWGWRGHPRHCFVSLVRARGLVARLDSISLRILIDI